MRRTMRMKRDQDAKISFCAISGSVGTGQRVTRE